MIVDNMLLAVILLGGGLSIFAVISECLTWRSDQVATLKASAALKALYLRTFQRKRQPAMRRQKA
jgi:hypothetical protein